MKPIIPVAPLSALSLCALLISCGGDIKTNDKPSPSSSAQASSAVSSNPASSSTASSQSPADSGRERFGSANHPGLCIGCHEPTDKELGYSYSLQSLTDFISANMPKKAPGSCTGSCASSIAAYIQQMQPTFGQGLNTPQTTLGSIKTAQGAIDAAPVTLPRLNRNQYNNTVKDLFGTQQRPADSFPEDDFGYGFNNIANVLSTSPSHVEHYLAAVESLTEEALTLANAAFFNTYNANSLPSHQAQVADAHLNMHSTGSFVHLDYTPPLAGKYTFTLQAWQQKAGTGDAQISVFVDGTAIQTLTVPNTSPQTFTISLNLSAGAHALKVVFINDFYQKTPLLDRNLLLGTLSLTGPISSQTASKQVIPCAPNDGLTCARSTAQQFGARAWRRPLSGAEVDSLLALYTEGANAAGPRLGFSQMLKGLLLSPHFLYRPEIDPNLTSSQPRALNAYELASRLSYFLWSSLPDAPLFAAAADGSLLQDATLRAQVVRMLADPKARALQDNFAAQWLKLDKILQSQPDATLFPGFTPTLAKAAREETRLFIQNWLNTNAPTAQLINAKTTYINGPLASHYGISGISGDAFSPYTWANNQRQGLLGQAAILTLTSNPNKTSPVRRGNWVLETLLCKSPPPPPANVPVIGDEASVEGLTTRQRFEKHREKGSSCFACHQLMDPIGFGLENFTAIGTWRDNDSGLPVDASGILPGNQHFNGPAELNAIIAATPELPLCTIEHLATYGLGRGLNAHSENPSVEPSDYPFIYSVYAKTQAQGFRIQDIIQEIVLSPAFKTRRGADSSIGVAP